MLRHLLLAVCLFFGQSLTAECNFKTGRYINELREPHNILKIELKVAKSAKYARNAVKIILSNSRNIPTDLKKKFKANVKVYYPFGVCSFEAMIRQNGDWKDHIKLTNGGAIIRSLDVKLLSGNILSAVRFKLLLPETRNSEHEILATQILKELDFISPETFAVAVSVNDTETIMLFQEKAAKELLERNLRRESAIYEGDEQLLWSFLDFDLFELSPLSLSRLTNKNWFIKGSSSQNIALRAFSTLQNTYLEAIDQSLYNVVLPNIDNRNFEEFAFSLIVMNASHGLQNHNRKFYYNSLQDRFEPIYYDGVANFSELAQSHMGHSLTHILKTQFSKDIGDTFVSKLTGVLNSAKLKTDFLNRAEKLKIDSEGFYDAAIESVRTNINILRAGMSSGERKIVKKSGENLQSDYIKRTENANLKQIIFTNLQFEKNGFQAVLLDGTIIEMSMIEAAELISRNTFQGQRAILLKFTPSKFSENYLKRTLQGFPADLYSSPGITFKFAPEKKMLYVYQTKETDWLLIKNGHLKDWTIKFEGKTKKQIRKAPMGQRFNNFGITGCLTIYKTRLSASSLSIIGGACEDSLNIISSQGNLSALEIRSALSDAIDMDYSSVSIEAVSIIEAGNDCIDVSGGKYVISSANFHNCGDKGISVGEGSELFASDVSIYSSQIGVSAKDYSTVTVDNARFKDVTTCVEARNKKQEFGGAFAVVRQTDCSGAFEFDESSVLTVGYNEL